MRQLVSRRTIFTLLMLGASAERGSASAKPAPAAETPARGAYTPARQCASCHEPIYTYWSESAHAKAASTPAYLDAVAAASTGAADPPAVQRGCTWCHAPTTLVTGDHAFALPITKEGVTCDFCHTVADVELGKADHPFDLEPGKLKRGPLQYVQTPSHETAYSVLHKSSPLLCAACHEYRNGLGALVLSTYSEWREGPYPSRGMGCQECHMPLVPGSTVKEGLKSTQRVINLHRMVGGGVASQVGRGLELKIDSVDNTGDSAKVQVVVTNAAGGHPVPGGLSTKALVLVVGIAMTEKGELLQRRERAYFRVLTDAQGNALNTVPDLFLKAAAVGPDTRIKPKEARRERFTIPLPEGATSIVARLEYRDSSDRKAGPKTTLILEERRSLAPR